MNKKITVEMVVHAPIKKVWDAWNNPSHIPGWAFASDTWEAPYAENDLRVGGKFLTHMSAKDGSASFDFTGTYTEVVLEEKIAYTMDGDDKRKVTVIFETVGEKEVKIIEEFEMENENPEEAQRGGWQSILNNFKKYAESL